MLVSPTQARALLGRMVEFVLANSRMVEIVTCAILGPVFLIRGLQALLERKLSTSHRAELREAPDDEETGRRETRPMRIVPLIVVGLVAFALAGCGGSDAGDEGAVQVTMGQPSEYAMTPVPAEVSAGAVTFDVANEGKLMHEMVVIKTDEGAANLGLPNGEADEADAIDEVADLPAGDTATLDLDLPAGKYALVCNLPGHYAAGMYADFTVK